MKIYTRPIEERDFEKVKKPFEIKNLEPSIFSVAPGLASTVVVIPFTDLGFILCVEDETSKTIDATVDNPQTISKEIVTKALEQLKTSEGAALFAAQDALSRIQFPDTTGR